MRVKGYDHILDVRGVFVDELSDASRVFIRRADCELGVRFGWVMALGDEMHEFALRLGRVRTDAPG